MLLYFSEDIALHKHHYITKQQLTLLHLSDILLKNITVIFTNYFLNQLQPVRWTEGLVYLSIVAENSIPKPVATAHFLPKQYCGLRESDRGTDISNFNYYQVDEPPFVGCNIRRFRQSVTCSFCKRDIPEIITVSQCQETAKGYKLISSLIIVDRSRIVYLNIIMSAEPAAPAVRLLLISHLSLPRYKTV